MNWIKILILLSTSSLTSSFFFGDGGCGQSSPCSSPLLQMPVRQSSPCSSPSCSPPTQFVQVVAMEPACSPSCGSSSYSPKLVALEPACTPCGNNMNSPPTILALEPSCNPPSSCDSTSFNTGSNYPTLMSDNYQQPSFLSSDGRIYTVASRRPIAFARAPFYQIATPAIVPVPVYMPMTQKLKSKNTAFVHLPAAYSRQGSPSSYSAPYVKVPPPPPPPPANYETVEETEANFEKPSYKTATEGLFEKSNQIDESYRMSGSATVLGSQSKRGLTPLSNDPKPVNLSNKLAKKSTSDDPVDSFREAFTKFGNKIAEIFSSEEEDDDEQTEKFIDTDNTLIRKKKDTQLLKN